MIRITIIIIMITHVYGSNKLYIKRLVHEMRNSIALTHQYIVTTMGRISLVCLVTQLHCSTIDFNTQTCTHFCYQTTDQYMQNLSISLGRKCRYSQLMKLVSQKLLITKFMDTHTDINKANLRNLKAATGLLSGNAQFGSKSVMFWTV